MIRKADQLSGSLSGGALPRLQWRTAGTSRPADCRRACEDRPGAAQPRGDRGAEGRHEQPSPLPQPPSGDRDVGGQGAELLQRSRLELGARARLVLGAVPGRHPGARGVLPQLRGLPVYDRRAGPHVVGHPRRQVDLPGPGPGRADDLRLRASSHAGLRATKHRGGVHRSPLPRQWLRGAQPLRDSADAVSGVLRAGPDARGQPGRPPESAPGDAAADLPLPRRRGDLLLPALRGAQEHRRR